MNPLRCSLGWAIHADNIYFMLHAAVDHVDVDGIMFTAKKLMLTIFTYFHVTCCSRSCRSWWDFVYC